MACVYLGLGTNLGDKDRQLKCALAYLQERVGTLVSLSSFYETAPWGFVSDHAFLNAVAAFETSLSPEELLRVTQEIERLMGRTQKSEHRQYHDRPIDLDILLYGDEIIEREELVLPHPEMTQRRFVMEPLAEIAPTLHHPLLGKTMQELLAELPEE